jgi:hypothetical protein
MEIHNIMILNPIDFLPIVVYTHGKENHHA